MSNVPLMILRMQTIGGSSFWATCVGVIALSIVAITWNTVLASREKSRKLFLEGPEIIKTAVVSDIVQISPDTFRYVVALPEAKEYLGIKPGQHVILHSSADSSPNSNSNVSKNVSRKYTPLTLDESPGMFELLVKVYPPSAAHPEGESMSQIVGQWQIGDSVYVSGPVAKHLYLGNGVFYSYPTATQKICKNLIMFIGGTGITPAYQIIASALSLSHQSDNTHVRLVFSNRRTEDILLRDQLEELLEHYAKRLSILYVLTGTKGDGDGDTATPSASASNIRHGRIDEALIHSELKQFHQTDSIVITSGPQALIHETVTPALESCGWARDRLIVY